ncbi:MAG: hypothetical protein ABR606_08165 [Vicinamibacterales bacterium]
MCLISRTGMFVLSVMAMSAPAHGQGYEYLDPAGGPFSAVVLNAPFSAKAVTRVREPLPHGAVREQTVTATLIRDSQGRVRAELDNPWGLYVVMWIPGPEREIFYRLDPAERTYRFTGRAFGSRLFNGEGRVAVPLGNACFRLAPPVAGVSGTERLEAVNAEMSSDLGLVIASHRSDHIASIDYELTNIRREEPPAELFDVPASYTLVHGSMDDPLVEFDAWNAKRFCVGARTP